MQTQPRPEGLLMEQLLYASEVLVNGLMAGVMYSLVALGFVLIF